MVVLVRCSDDTYTLALESRLSELINEGLIVAFLRDGDWIPVKARPSLLETLSGQLVKNRLAVASVSC